MSAIKLGESELLKPVVKVGLSTVYKKKQKNFCSY